MTLKNYLLIERWCLLVHLAACADVGGYQIAFVNGLRWIELFESGIW